MKRLLAFAVLAALAIFLRSAHAQDPFGKIEGDFPLKVFKVLADPVRPRVYAADTAANGIVVIDTTTLQTVATVPTGAHPVDISISPDGSTLYVANAKPKHPNLGVLDLDTLVVRANFPLPEIPSSIAAGLGGRVYAILLDDYGNGGIYLINGGTGAVEATFGDDFFEAGSLGTTPDGKTLIFAESEMSQIEIQRFDVSTAMPVVKQTLEDVDPSGFQMRVSTTGKYVLLPYDPASTFTSYVQTAGSLFDPADITHSYGSFLDASAEFTSLAFSPDDTLVYAVCGTFPDRTLATIDSRTFTQVASAALPAYDPGEFNDDYDSTVVDNTGTYLFVTDHDTYRSRLLVLATGNGALSPLHPTVTLTFVANGTTVETQQESIITLTRTGDLTNKLVVDYVVHGSARNGVDYEMLSGEAKFRPNKATTAIRMIPTNTPTTETILKFKVRLLPGSDYQLGDTYKTGIKFQSEVFGG